MNDLSITWPIVLMTIFSALVVSLILMCLLRTCGGCLIIAVIVLYFGLLISFGVICLATA